MLKQRGRKRGLTAAVIGAGALLLSLGLRTGPALAAAPAEVAPLTQSSDLYIYDHTGTALLGRAHYTVVQHDGIVTIEGRNDFIDGERDVEHDTLRSVNGGLPRMVSYEHSFFDAHGAAQIVARANAVSGKSSCAKYEGGNGSTQEAELDFPPDTYAGAGVLVPIADQFRRGTATDLDFHVFDCALGPRILSLHVDLARSPWSFLPHDGELGKADAHPVFGWFNVFLKPFVPTIRMWFDPLRDFAFVGGMLSRYYRGPEVLLVRAAPAVKPEPAFERPEPPSLTAPHDSAPPPAQSSSTASSAAGPSPAPPTAQNASAAPETAPSAGVTATPAPGTAVSTQEGVAPAENSPAH